MCLVVKHVPANKRTELITVCFKLLRKTTISGDKRYVTYYQDYLVPNDGWLLRPSRYPWERTKDYYYNRTILGDHFHAYESISFWRKRFWDTAHMTRAYAFGVKAFGNKNDLVCKALFVPDADTLGYLKETENKIIKLLDKKHLTTKMVVKAFPFLSYIWRR